VEGHGRLKNLKEGGRSLKTIEKIGRRRMDELDPFQP
jgi:hypothetical protein